ncbi:SCO5717 family growth-regulating ATPase [Streptomyces sp. NPDC050732]|uniref:SCO5717 family growth-regulating ATPase n=1 Tax=Streptomyces sp. NPDC050732 TaxID=3154632 RepID=UPI003447655F
MATELEALAAEAADVLVGAMWGSRNRWLWARDEFGEFFRQSGARAGENELDIDRTQVIAQVGDRGVLRRFWNGVLYDCLRTGGGLRADRLRIIVADSALVAGGERGTAEATESADITGDFAIDYTPPAWYTAGQSGSGQEKEAGAQAGPGARNSVTGGTQAAVVQADSIGSVTVNAPPAQPAPQHAAADGWPRLGGLRRLGLGVRPTRRFPGATALPPYVTRDCDDELSVLLKQAAHYGGLVIVTGGPLSGKTSTAWAALRASVPDDTRVFVAGGGANLGDLPDQLRGREPGNTHVVWLDDLDGHLAEPGTPGVLAQLTHDRVLVLATMRDAAYEKHRFGHHPAARVLSIAQTVEVPTEWSGAELARLAAVDDPRLADAVRWRGTLGVTEFLALGPDLWEEWRRARRAGTRLLGHLLVRAAIDLARCGLTRGVTPELLRQVQEEYDLEGPHARDAKFEDALAWATGLRHGVTGLLVPGEWPGTWRAYGSLIADATRSDLTEPVPDRVWLRAYEDLEPHDPAELRALTGAFRLTLMPRAANGDADAMAWLGLLAGDEGDTAAAEDWFRKAADRGHARAAGRLGHLLATRVAYQEAVPYLTAAAEAGEPGAAALLGQVHQHLAVHYFRIAESEGDTSATHRLKGLLRPIGPPPAHTRDPDLD